MRRNDLAKIGLFMVVIMLGSCARGIVAPPGLNSKITDIQVNDTDSATIITVKTSNLPQYASFKAKSPPSVTLDLASTDAADVSRSLSIGNGVIDKITVEQLGASTGYSSRIVVTLEKSYSYNVTTDGNNIVLNISKTEEQPAEGMQPSPTTTAPELPSLAPLPGAEMTPTAAPEALAPLPGAEMTPTAAPEALAPLPGAEMTPTAAPEALAPLPGAEMTPTAAPEALAPMAGKAMSPPSVPSAPEAVTQAPSPTPVAVSKPKTKEKKENIAMLVPAPAVPAPVKGLKIKSNVIIPSVPLVFKNNEAVLSMDAEAGLRDVADYMLEHKSIKLIIEGYSDASGPESYNNELAYYRTLWVKMALERYGVPSNRLITKPMGGTSKFGHKKAGMAYNRRVVLIISK